MKPRKQYQVSYRRDESGWWVARVRGISGCHTQGRTIEQARRRIRESLGLFIGDAADSVRLVEEYRLPADARRKVDLAAAARQRMRAQAATADRATRRAVRALTKQGLSLRDTGELLGLSRQRVHQMLHEKTPNDE